MRTSNPVKSRRRRTAGVVVLLVLGWGQSPAWAADPSPGSPQTPDPRPAIQLEPTATCPPDAVAELNRAIDFVRGQAWTDRPGSHPLNVSPDLNICRVVLHVGQLSEEEEAALQAGAGSRLAIEYRRDWAKPSRLLLILWIVFGGSGVIWVYRRYGRR